jgi:DMSO reductase family type II enzyme heme b subunit
MSAALLLCSLVAASPATDAFLKAEGLAVAAVAALPTSTSDAAWQRVPPTDVALAPQLAITLNDKDANQARGQRTPPALTVRAASTGKDLALLLEWADAAEDRALTDETDRYGDGVAVEIPVRFGAGKRLPYVGMGDAGAPVLVHFARAAQAGAKSDVIVRTAVAAGFGSLTRAPIGWARAGMNYDAAAKRWRALFIRPLAAKEHTMDAALVPIAFAVWDGSRDQRGGNKLLSGWRFLRMPNKAPDAAFIAELAYGYGPGEVGDATRGKAFVETVCVSCHRIGAKAFAPADLAPELTNVGVVSSYAYLRDSVLAPSSVLVPSLNRNRHYNKAGPRDANGAYPHGDLGAFAAVDASGAPVSKMPAFSTMPKEQLADVLAYLKSLGATP